MKLKSLKISVKGYYAKKIEEGLAVGNLPGSGLASLTVQILRVRTAYYAGLADSNQTFLTRVSSQLKMAQPHVRLCAALLLNVNYIWVFIKGPTQFSLRCGNSENYVANG
jgi:hypothetical protein